MQVRRLILALLVGATSASAQEHEAMVTFQSLKPEVALEMAQTALRSCRDAGYQVGVSVVDRFGVEQVFLRDQFAGPHVRETAFRKAWTAVSFRTDTVSLDQSTRPDGSASGIRAISLALPLGGGVPVDAAGSLVAGIGVSGAPSPDLDDECARDGIAAIEDRIAF